MSHMGEMRQVVRKLKKQGFAVDQAPNGHYRVEGPDGQRTQVSFSPGSSSGVRTQIQRLKHIGFVP
jgi:predicted RNA binding protein YcfA (HicA-like mRNA interferase family)